MRSKSRLSTSAPAAAPAGATALPLKVGWLLEGSSLTSLAVDFEGNAVGPIKARTTILLDEAGIRQAVAVRQGALLLFENGDPLLPIVIGLVAAEPGAALFASLLRGAETPADATPAEARLEGRRVLIEGDTEVTLRCGDASITLRSDGKVILRGAYVETTAKGVNRIRGGSVKIN